MTKKILVTGGAGFIGSALVEELSIEKKNNIVIIDNYSTGSVDKVPKSKFDNIRSIKADVNNFREMEGIFYSNNFDYVFHYAAMVGVKRTLANPVGVLNDIDGIKNVLSLAKNTGVKRVFYSSSSEVYGEPVEYPQNEHTTPLNSRLPYAIVKNVGEAFFKSYHKEYGLEYTIFRLFNTYGPKQSVDFVMSKFIASAINNKDITVYGEGNQTRTFCYVKDNIAAMLSAFYNDKIVNDVANIGSDQEITILELAKLIIKIVKSKSKVIHLPALEEGDMTRRRPDINKMKSLLERNLTQLEKGIKETIANIQFMV
jgi:UDP-glucuronate decarboxylase